MPNIADPKNSAANYKITIRRQYCIEDHNNKNTFIASCKVLMTHILISNISSMFFIQILNRAEEPGYIKILMKNNGKKLLQWDSLLATTINK